MPVRIVVGVNWGDEGKGRMVDYFAKTADYVVRYQGGSNAGHTVVNEFGKFKLHLMPSGIFYNNVVNVLGPGTVVSLDAAVKEMQELQAKGISVTPENYKIADRAMICFPFHKLQDGYEEERLGSKSFGSTKQGIAPVYGDKYMKKAIQMGSLFHPEYFREELEKSLDLKNAILEKVYENPAVSVDEMYNWAMKHFEILKPHIVDTVELFEPARKLKKSVLLEGQLGTLRDISYGIYPYTTSSCTLSAYAYVGSGFFTQEMPVITGVMKAFSTCVGEGPFVTEIQGELASQIREVAEEYGAATGRPRRIGHFDVVASTYGAKVQNVSELALTKLDSLSGLKTLSLCTHYEVNGRTIKRFPLNAELVKAKPVYMEMPGWTEDISKVRSFEELPATARKYVETIEKLVEAPIKYVSVGPEREALIIR